MGLVIAPYLEVISPESQFTQIDHNHPRQIDPEPSQEPEKSRQNFEFQSLGLVSQLDSTNQNITFSIARLTALIVKILSDAKDPDFWKADRDFRLKSASSRASAVTHMDRSLESVKKYYTRKCVCNVSLGSESYWYFRKKLIEVRLKHYIIKMYIDYPLN